MKVKILGIENVKYDFHDGKPVRQGKRLYYEKIEKIANGYGSKCDFVSFVNDNKMPLGLKVDDTVNLEYEPVNGKVKLSNITKC